MFIALFFHVLQQAPSLHVRSLTDVGTELSSLSGKPVVVAPGLRSHLILLDRRGASAETALRTVAKSLRASLLRDANGYRIERTPDDERRMADDRSAQRLSWLETKLKAAEEFQKARLSKTNPETSTIDEIERTGQSLQSFFRGASFQVGSMTANDLLPSASLLRSLVRRVGLKTLSELPNGMHVYEDAPAFAAKPLPKTGDLIESCVASLRALNIDRVREAYGKALGEYVNEDPFSGSPTSATEVAKLRLAVASNDNGMTLSLEGFNRSGNRVLSSSMSISPNQEQFHPSTLMRDPRFLVRANMVKLSEEAGAAAAFASASGSARFPKWFLHPDEREPLDGFVREALVGLIAGEDQRCVAVDVSDSLWGNVLGCVRDGRINLDVLQEVLRQWSPYVKVQDASSTVWRPIDGKAAEARSADRKALAAFAANVEREGYPTVRALSRLYRDASPMIGSLANDWHTFGKVNARIETGNDGMFPRLYRLLGAIPTPKWERLQKGQTLTAGELGIVRELVVFLNDDLGLPIIADAPVADLYRHPLEGFESARLADVPLTLRAPKGPVVRLWSVPNPEGSLWMPDGAWTGGLVVTAFGYREGRFVCEQTREAFEVTLGGLRFRQGVREDVTVVLGLPKNRSISGAWHGPTFPEGKTRVYADFPESFREAAWRRAYETGLKQAIRMRDAARAGGTGSAARPSTSPPQS